jgi:hypothetical protein
MTTLAWTIRRLHGVSGAEIAGLADVLVDCVEGGASVSFMHPRTRETQILGPRNCDPGARGFSGPRANPPSDLGACGER